MPRKLWVLPLKRRHSRFNARSALSEQKNSNKAVTTSQGTPAFVQFRTSRHLNYTNKVEPAWFPSLYVCLLFTLASGSIAAACSLFRQTPAFAPKASSIASYVLLWIHNYLEESPDFELKEIVRVFVIFTGGRGALYLRHICADLVSLPLKSPLIRWVIHILSIVQPLCIVLIINHRKCCFLSVSDEENPLIQADPLPPIMYITLPAHANSHLHHSIGRRISR